MGGLHRFGLQEYPLGVFASPRYTHGGYIVNTVKI
jgi:hypothetical protein